MSFLHVVMLLVLREDLQSIQGHIFSSKAELTKAKHTHTLMRHAGRAISKTVLSIMYGLRKTTVPYSLIPSVCWCVREDMFKLLVE